MRPLLFSMFLILLLKNSAELNSVGDKASLGQFPWQAELFTAGYNNWESCSGAILTEEWILVTEGCIYIKFSAAVVVGAVEVNITDLLTTNHSSTEQVDHYHYNETTGENNIGLVKLTKPLDFSDYVKPISLADTEIREGINLTMSGWSDNLWVEYFTLTTITKNECEKVYGEGSIPDGIFCAYRNEVTGSDFLAGGPAVIVDDTNEPILVGLLNEYTSSTKKEPLKFVDVFYYQDWVKNATGL